MAQLDVREKLEILADAAKYDASCASSGTAKRSSADGKGLGSTEGMGICHAYAPDGRCISLLKILLTNSCIFDCAYCINRKSSNVRRARFTAKEVVDLTLSFYKRNYIEGLFLSSGIIKSSDYTMEQIVEVARSLREDHNFRGYIHLKTIPDADPMLVHAAGLHADRISINVELPTRAGLSALAPEKDEARIDGAMGAMKERIGEAVAERKVSRHAPRFAPAGQSTQMIVGADGADDRAIIGRASGLYGSHKLRRVYYSAFSPIPDASAVLPLSRPPLMREHRLYQSDWMLRFYGFSAAEVADAADDTGHLPLDMDPQARLGAEASRRLPGRREPRQPLAVAAGTGAGDEGGGPHPGVPPPPHAAPGRCCAHDRVGRQAAPFPDHRRLAAHGAVRQVRPVPLGEAPGATDGAVRRLTLPSGASHWAHQGGGLTMDGTGERNTWEWMMLPLKRYADFSGRSRRKEYWLFVLFETLSILLIGLVTAGVFGGLVNTQAAGEGLFGGLAVGFIIVLLVVALALFLPNLAVQVRRLHDQDKSGWLVLIGFIPYVGGLIMFVFMLLEGTKGPNSYGPDPKGQSAVDPSIFA